MSGLAFACAANSGDGGYRRSSRKIVSIAWWVSVATRYLRTARHGRCSPRPYRGFSPHGGADGKDAPGRHAVDHAGRGRVPGGGSGEYADPAAEVEDVCAVAVGHPEEPDREHDLSDLQRQEDEEYGDADTRAPEKHVRVEDRERNEEPGERVVDVRPLEAGAERRGLGQDHEGPEREPEAAVGRERRRAEDVAVPDLPHPGEELHHPAVEERCPEPDDVGDERGVVPAQHEGGQGERGQAERRRVGSGNRLDLGRKTAFLHVGGHLGPSLRKKEQFRRKISVDVSFKRDREGRLRGRAASY